MRWSSSTPLAGVERLTFGLGTAHPNSSRKHARWAIFVVGMIENLNAVVAFRSMGSELAPYFVPELRGIKAVAVPEHDAHVANRVCIRGKVAPDHHQVCRLANLDRPDALLLAEDARAVECHD